MKQSDWNKKQVRVLDEGSTIRKNVENRIAHPDSSRKIVMLQERGDRVCILRAYSSDKSFKGFAELTSIPIYSCVDKGEIKNKAKGTVFQDNRISFDVSERDWDDLEGQVQDAISFLEKWENDLLSFINKFSPDELILDFALYSRINEDVVNQNDYLPANLVKVAGRLGIGIGMSIYSKDALV